MLHKRVTENNLFYANCNQSLKCKNVNTKRGLNTGFEKVVEKVGRAIASDNTRARYFVIIPACADAVMARLFPDF